MKKIFITLLALVSVSLVCATLTSCGSDDNDPATPANVDYSFEYILSADLLEICDVKTIVTVGSTSTELKYTNSKNVAFQGENFKCLSTGTQPFQAASGTPVTSKTTATLKSNWREIASKKNNLNIGYHWKIKGYNFDSEDGMGYPQRTDDLSDRYETNLKSIINSFCGYFDYSNSK